MEPTKNDLLDFYSVYVVHKIVISIYELSNQRRGLKVFKMVCNCPQYSIVS